MGKNGLKLRVKKLDNTGYAVQQRLRKSHILYWQTLEVCATLDECQHDFPYAGIERTCAKLKKTA